MIAIQNKTSKMKYIEKKRSLPIEEILRAMYVDQRLTIEEISFELEIGYITAFKWLKWANVTSRGFNLEGGETHEHRAKNR
jgi:hypothetical protein